LSVTVQTESGAVWKAIRSLFNTTTFPAHIAAMTWPVKKHEHRCTCEWIMQKQEREQEEIQNREKSWRILTKLLISGD
jgi:hypothetical protein